MCSSACHATTTSSSPSGSEAVSAVAACTGTSQRAVAASATSAAGSMPSTVKPASRACARNQPDALPISSSRPPVA
jgi:hypothetical protein